MCFPPSLCYLLVVFSFLIWTMTIFLSNFFLTKGGQLSEFCYDSGFLESDLIFPPFCRQITIILSQCVETGYSVMHHITNRMSPRPDLKDWGPPRAHHMPELNTDVFPLHSPLPLWLQRGWIVFARSTSWCSNFAFLSDLALSDDAVIVNGWSATCFHGLAVSLWSNEWSRRVLRWVYFLAF